MSRVVNRIDDLSKLIDKVKESDIVAIDFETSAFSADKDAALQHDKIEVVGFSICFDDEDCAYVPLMHTDGINANRTQARALLSEICENKDLEVYAHNHKFEYTVFRTMGFQPKYKIRDTMAMQWLVGKTIPGAGGLKLKAAVKEFLGHTMTTFEEVTHSYSSAFRVPIDTMAKYCCDDSLQCLRLAKLFLPEIEEYQLKKVYEDLEMPFLPVLVHMKECGFAIDKTYLNNLYAEFNEEREDIRQKFFELTKVSIASSKQISAKLYDELKWWPCEGFVRGKSGSFSCDADHLEVVTSKMKPSTPGLEAVLLKSRYQTLDKLAGTYTKPLVAQASIYSDGRVRGDFHQFGTVTSRLASANPNLQNIPTRTIDGNRIRNAFVSEPGWSLIVSDYSQADLVMMAHLSQDPMLLKAYNEHLDLHQQTADNCGCDRSTGKTINLGLIYEMGVRTLQGNLTSIKDNKIVSKEEAVRLWEAWHRTYPFVAKYHKKMHAFAEKHGYVRTITGRIRLLPNILSKEIGKRIFSQHAASNSPDQGSVADTIKIATRNLFYEWKNKGILYDYWTKQGHAKIISQVHDELIIEAKDEFAEELAVDVQRHMEHAVSLRAPMTAIPGIGKTWNLAKEDGKRREKEAAKRFKESQG
jgi:DNA polymerase-1